MSDISQCNTNINCYFSWKNNPNRITALASNSRPIPQPRKWHAPGRPMPECNNGVCGDNNIPFTPAEFNHDDYISGAGFIRRRSIQGATKNINNVWNSAAPNPIKHWRRQLFPRQFDNSDILFSLPTGRISISQTMDRPGGSMNLDPLINYGPDCSGAHPSSVLTTSFYLNKNIKHFTLKCKTFLYYFKFLSIDIINNITNF